MDLSTIPLFVLAGELRGNLLSIATMHDPHGVYDEGAQSYIQMELKWSLRTGYLVLNVPKQFSAGEWYYATSFGRNETFYVLVAPSLEHLTEELQSSVQSIRQRGALFTARELYEEILSSQLEMADPLEMLELTPFEAQERLRGLAISAQNLDSVSLLLQLLSDYNHTDDVVVYEKTVEMLGVIQQARNLNHRDEYLDAANVIADRRNQTGQRDQALYLYDRISALSQYSDRKALNLNARLHAAQIANDLKHEPKAILDRIQTIDDADLNSVSHTSRVLFYTLQGAAYEGLNDMSQAAAYHEMAIAISKSDIVPSVYFASSYGFMAKMDAASLRPDLATSKFLTASNIATNHGKPELANYYADQAAKQELLWADILRSTAVNHYMSGQRSDATFALWQSIRKVVDSYIHGSRLFHQDGNGIGISKAIIDDGMILVNRMIVEYGEETLQTVEQQLKVVQSNELTPIEEAELLRFLISRISNMIPIPPPIVMIIGLDGRLLLGGQIGGDSSSWNEADEDLNVLFSGALTAIMAMLSEVISDKNPLRMLDVGQTQIMIERTDTCIGTVLVDRELVILRKALQNSLAFIQSEFPQLRDTMESYKVNLNDAIPVIEQYFIEALTAFH
ncbi:MAG: hypothetical protein ACXAE3_07050 [Candidatus Kariarchaeaceae archaeon]